MTSNAKFQLHEAAREGKTSLVESLLNADPKSALKKDDDDRLPLHWASSYNHPDIVQLLLTSSPKHAETIDERDGSGWTALMMASSVKDADPLVDLLLSRDADANLTNNNGQTALHFAASKNHLDVARALLGKGGGGKAVRTKDRRGQLPLHRAAAVGSVPMLRLLLENRSPVNGADVDGMTALHHAVAEGHGDAAVFLLQNGAEHDKQDRDGNVAMALSPDDKVRSYIRTAAEREGIDLP